MSVPTTSPRMRRAKVAVNPPSNGYPRADTKIPEPPRDEKPTVTTKVEVPSPKPGPVARWVANKYRGAGELLKPMDPICAQALILSADNAGMAWERAYKSSDVIKKMIDRLMESTVVADLFFANLPIAMAVLSHHSEPFRNYVNNSFLGFMVPPDLKETEPKESAA